MFPVSDSANGMRPAHGPGRWREASVPAVNRTLARVFAQLAVSQPALGLPPRGDEFAAALLDPSAAKRTELPAISPRAALELLCELMRVDRLREPYVGALDVHLNAVAHRVHRAMLRYLDAHREACPGRVLVLAHERPEHGVRHDLHRGRFTPVLYAALRSTLLLDLERRLQHPVRVRREPGGAVVYVEVLGCLRYRHDLRRRDISVEQREVAGWRVGSSVRILPLAPLENWAWVLGFVAAHAPLWHASARAAAWHPDDVYELTYDLESWLAASVRVAARRSGVLACLRHAIRAALPYDPEMIELACRVRRQPAARLCATDIEQALGCRDEYATLRRETPRLMHLGMLLRDPPEIGDPCDAQTMKRQLRDAGLSRAGWRLLCRYGTRVYGDLVRPEHDVVDVLRLAVAMANRIAGCQRRGLPSRELVRQLGALENLNPTDSHLVGMPLLRAAWDAARALPTRHARRAFAAGDFARGVVWWWRAGQTRKPPAGADWAWFATQVARWEAAERNRRTVDGEHWRCPVASLHHQSVVAVALESGAALWNEGVAMGHCVGLPHFAETCMEGDLCVYGLRAAATGERIATVAFRRDADANWQQAELSGPTNRRMDRADVQAAVAALLQALNGQ